MHFKTRVEIGGGSRTRSDTEDNTIDLENGVKIITTPFGVGVDFQCNYKTSVELSSEAFTVQDVSMSGTHTAIGSLDTGFNMVAGDGSTIVLGNEITVTTTWELNIAGVQPHYRNCAVIHGEEEVQIIKDGCMSETLGVETVANVAGVTNAVSMKLKTFMMENASAATQTVACTVMICQGTGNCARAADADTSCKQLNDPFNYA